VPQAGMVIETTTPGGRRDVWTAWAKLAAVRRTDGWPGRSPGRAVGQNRTGRRC
jgi:hypothetical protein